jgi:FkbM family methyltransferase
MAGYLEECSYTHQKNQRNLAVSREAYCSPIIAIKLRFRGARIVGVTQKGNTILRLNKDYALGLKGTDLELPRDLTIFQYVKSFGNWELQESEFLAMGLREVAKLPNSKAALLDIGANTGLVTLQAMNLSKTTVEVFLFEPIPRHVSAIKNNLRNVPDIHINEFALSDANGESEIFTQTTNHGNTSLIKSVVPSDELISTKIQLVSTSEYCDTSLTNFDSYVIKCDTQGMDALILSRIPNRIWQSTEFAIVEVWALPEIREQDVTHLLAMWQNFQYAKWDLTSQESIGLSEIGEYWLSKSGTQRNLFLSKTFPF